MPTPVFVVDDHRTLAELIGMSLDAQHDLSCAGVAHSVAEARRLARTVSFGAAVVDLGLSDGDGVTVVEDLRRLVPDAIIVVLTAHPRSDLARRALHAGADHVLPKRGAFDDVLAALRNGAPVGDVIPFESPLTAREKEVLTLLARGTDVRRISVMLRLSELTVRDHVKAVLAKLGVRSQLEAVVAATRLGIIVLEPE